MDTAAHQVPSGPLTSQWADALGLVVWKAIVVAFWTMVIGWPGRPRTIVGGVILIAWVLLVAVPWAWVSRRVGNPVFDNPLARRLAVRTDHNASGVRVLYLLGIFLVGGPLVLAAAFAVGAALAWVAAAAGISAMLHPHFR